MKAYSPALAALLKGVVYDTNRDIWQNLLQHEIDVKRHFNEIPLEVYIDKLEGHAFLKNADTKQDDGTDAPAIIPRRPLSFPISLLCLLLRKHLLETDSQGQTTRAMLTKDEIINMMKPFLHDSLNEAKQSDQIETAINKVKEEGFLRKLNNENELFEINRIIKAFINAEVVQDTLDKFINYRQENNGHA
jgi:hypothetical protein